MGATQYYTATSLDGYIADENNSLEWLFEVDRGADGGEQSFAAFFADLHRAAEDLLERVIADVGTETDGIEIELQVVQGPAAEVGERWMSPSSAAIV